MKRLLFVILILPFSSLAQLENWEFGVNLGTYKANSYTSIRYDGADVEYNYNLDVVYYINLNSSNPNSVYNRIRQSYGDYDFDVLEYPTNMRYNFGLMLGGHIAYKTDELNSFFVDANFAQLTLNDALTFEVFDPSNQTSQQIIKVEGLLGEEDRMVLDVGGKFGFGEEAQHGYFTIGANVTATRVKKSSMVVQDREYILTQWTRNATNQNSIYQNVDWGGVGYGAFAGLGYRFRLLDQLVLDAGANAYFVKINLGPDNIVSHPKAFKFQSTAYLRIIWG